MKERRDYLLYLLCVACCCLSIVLAVICYISLPFQRPLRIAIIADRLYGPKNLDLYSSRHSSYIPYNPKLIELPASILGTLENSETYEKITSVWNLPYSVFELCAGSEGKMANPGQSWEATDMISDFTGALPSRRLLWAASIAQGRYFIVHYEIGGFALYRNFVIAELNGNAVNLLWYGYGGAVWRYEDFLKELKSVKFYRHKAFNGLMVDNGSLSKFSFR